MSPTETCPTCLNWAIDCTCNQPAVSTSAAQALHDGERAYWRLQLTQPGSQAARLARRIDDATDLDPDSERGG